MDIFLQVWGGLFYLLNKVFLSRAEGTNDGRKWRIAGWAVYLIGLPAWVIILVVKRDWMAAGIETGGAPAMLLGLIVAIKGCKKIPRLLEKGTELFVYGFLAIGVAYSLYDFGGITAVSQVLEISCMAGFLLGTYLLAKEKPAGWLWFMLMNASMGLLMLIQHHPILTAQQMVSLCFVIRGYIRSRRQSKTS